jgi:hypothetical protein
MSEIWKQGMKDRRADPTGEKRARSLEYSSLRALLRDLEEPIVRTLQARTEYEDGYIQGGDDNRLLVARQLHRAMRDDGLVD